MITRYSEEIMNNLTHRLSCVFEELGFDKTVLNNKELFLHKENTT